MKREDFIALNRLADGDLPITEEADLRVRVATDPELAEMLGRIEALAEGWPHLAPVKAPPLAFPLSPWERVRSAVLAPVRIPAVGLAAAAALLLALGGYLGSLNNPFSFPAQLTLPVHLVLYAPEAKTVELVGDFEGWGGSAMRPAGDSGYWVAELSVPPGEYRYLFLVDGRERVADATADRVVEDDFGSRNAVLRVGI